jgi:hypothetical protein
VDPEEVGPDVAVAGGRLDRLHAGQAGEIESGRVVGAADDDAQLVAGEAREEIGRRRFADEAAVVDDRDAVADALDVVEDVGRVEDGRLALQRRHEVEDLATADRVERADGLVEEQHAGPGHERLGDAQPLPHPARVRAGPAIRGVGEAHAPDAPGRSRPGRRWSRRP